MDPRHHAVVLVPPIPALVQDDGYAVHGDGHHLDESQVEVRGAPFRILERLCELHQEDFYVSNGAR